MRLGRGFGSLPGVAVAQILGLRARLASPRAALPPLTPPVGRPLACRQAPPRVRGSRPGVLSTAVECAAQGAWPPHWRPCPLWSPRRMPNGSVRRFWPRGPLWAARPDDPVARVQSRPGGAAPGRQAGLRGPRKPDGRQGRAALRPPAGAAGTIRPASARHAAGCPHRGGPAKTGEAAPARHAPRSPAITFWPHAASSGAACSP